MLDLDPVKKLEALGTVSSRDMGKASRINKSGMHFDLASYALEGVGYFSTIKMKAFFGLMEMESLILTPLDVDMPLLSYDSIRAFGKDTLLLELYDTQLERADLSSMDAVKASYAHLADKPKKPDWSDALLMSPSISKSGKGMASDYTRLADAWLDAYIALAKTAPACDREAKRAKVKEYTDKLFSLGGVAVNQFKKMLGDGPAIELLSRYIFSCDAE